ncbi:MAG: type II toxin-antitoxin system VapB family antitoxin [Acidithiobacillus sp.]
MEQATVFQINRSQTIRLPKSIAFPSDVKRVDVVALGRIRILVPAGESWESWFDGEGVAPRQGVAPVAARQARQGVSADFMESREQPADQHRECL